MDDAPNTQKNFLVKNCSLASIAVGSQASSLVELRDKLAIVDESSIYHHFWGGRMNPKFVHTQHHNDFAAWVYDRLHDHVLAERLGIIDPTEFNSLEDLRQDVIETIERRLDDYEIVLWTKNTDRFHFVRSTIIVFESAITITNPQELPDIIPRLSPGSIFYHFVDARVRTPEKTDDFTVWMKLFDGQYEILIEQIQSIDPYFLSLTQLREELAYILQRFFNDRET